MYEFLVKIMYELDYRKYEIEDLEKIKDILEELKGEVLETRLKHIKEDKGITYKKEEEDVSAMGEEKTDRGSGKSL